VNYVFPAELFRREIPALNVSAQDGVKYSHHLRGFMYRYKLFHKFSFTVCCQKARIVCIHTSLNVCRIASKMARGRGNVRSFTDRKPPLADLLISVQYL
jgi:hypothetical protein